MNLRLIRRVFYCLCLGLFLPQGLSAQNSFRRELALGVRAGYQFSQVNFDVGIPQRLHMGFTYGLVLQYLSQKQIGVQLEVNYSQRGLSAPGYGQALTVSRSFDYVEIPLLTHFSIGKKSFRIILNAGSYLSFLLDEQSANAAGVEPYYLLPLGRKWTYGLMGGLGVALRSRIGIFQLEGRGALGFTDLFNPETGEVFNNSPELFFGGQISYLYRFGGINNNNTDKPKLDESSIDHF